METRTQSMKSITGGQASSCLSTSSRSAPNSDQLVHILAETFSRKLNVGFGVFLVYGTSEYYVLLARTDSAPSYQGLFILKSFESHVPSG